MSFLLFYLRLSNTRRFTYMIYGTMALIVCFTIAIWLIYCLQCRPLAAFWNPTAYPDAVCLSTKITYYVVVALVSSCPSSDFPDWSFVLNNIILKTMAFVPTNEQK